jgi:hypothetical protein
VLTVIVCDVEPVDHKFPLPAEEVRSTDCPEQNVVGPLAVIVGVDGFALTVTTVAEEVAEQPAPFVTVTV